MPSLHIRNVDDAVVDELKARAAKNHRSLEGELRAILEAAAFPSGSASAAKRRRLNLKLVAVGNASAYGRDEIYGEEPTLPELFKLFDDVPCEGKTDAEAETP